MIRLRRRWASVANRTSWRETLVIATAWVHCVRTDVELRTRGSGPLKHRMVPAQQFSTQASSKDQDYARHIAHRIQWAAKIVPWPVECLSRSLVLVQHLSDRRIPATLIEGFQESDDGIKGHAWVEVGGLVVNDDADIGVRFKPVKRYDTGTAH